MTTDGDKSGVLQIDVDSKLYYRGQGIRVEIRDSDLILIQPATTRRRFDLPIGLYEISAVLEDGKRTTKIVAVTEKESTRISLDPDLPFQPPASIKEHDFHSLSEMHQLQSLKSEMELVDISSDVTVYAVESHWIIRHTEDMEQVPVATIRIAGRAVRASLPISAGDHRYSVTCHVKRHAEARSKLPEINISQSRSIASAMESMVFAGQFESAARLASNAMKTLLEKFVDPTGAVLAALILHKTDRLDDKLALLIHLVQRFDWLPDGKILLASQLARIPEKRHIASQLACDASKQRILFTETFSLLLDLLRYWPAEGDSSARSEALFRLGKCAPFVDWRSTYLCDRLPEDHDADAATPTRA